MKRTKPVPTFSPPPLLPQRPESYSPSIPWVSMNMPVYPQVADILTQKKIDRDRERVASLKSAAAKRDKNAQYQLGVYYAIGKGIHKNMVNAAYWYLKASENGHKAAQDTIGPTCLSLSSKFPEDLTVQYILGECYRNGCGIKPNQKKAVELFKQAASKSHAKAQYRLGQCYEFGIWLNYDLVKARHWYTASADQNHYPALRALNRLGLLDKNATLVKAPKASCSIAPSAAFYPPPSSKKDSQNPDYSNKKCTTTARYGVYFSIYS